MKAVTRLGTVPSETQKRGFPTRFLKKKCETRVKRLLCACVMYHRYCIFFNKRSFLILQCSLCI